MWESKPKNKKEESKTESLNHQTLAASPFSLVAMAWLLKQNKCPKWTTKPEDKSPQTEHQKIMNKLNYLPTPKKPPPLKPP
jgi:hypothetical protein